MSRIEIRTLHLPIIHRDPTPDSRDSREDCGILGYDTVQSGRRRNMDDARAM
jgi:hypothetical protein